MLLLELMVALAEKNWTGRRPGEKVDDSRMLMASDGGRIMLMVIVGALSFADVFLMDCIELHVCRSICWQADVLLSWCSNWSVLSRPAASLRSGAGAAGTSLVLGREPKGRG